MSEAEELLLWQIKVNGLPTPEREYVFAKSIGRKWRSDFAWPDHMLLVEVDGGTWSHGRHTRGAGYRKDCEKVNTATNLGFRTLRFTSEDVTDGIALGFIESALAKAEP